MYNLDHVKTKLTSGLSRIDEFIQDRHAQFQLLSNLVSLSIYLAMEVSFIPAAQTGQLTSVLWIPLGDGLSNLQGLSLQAFKGMMFVYVIVTGSIIYRTASRTPRRLVDGVFGMGTWRKWQRSRRFNKMADKKEDANESSFTESFVMKTTMPLHYVTPGKGVAQLRQDESKYEIATEV